MHRPHRKARERGNRCARLRVLGDVGAIEHPRANDQEESNMNTAVALASLAATPRPRARTSDNDSSFGAHGTPHTRARIGGRMSLVDRGPLTISAEHGLVLRVRIGAIWCSQPGDGQYWLVRAGDRFTAHRTGPLVVRAVERNEIEVEWPPLADERLSPGLEPVTLAP
jgi:hypothetical protein